MSTSESIRQSLMEDAICDGYDPAAVDDFKPMRLTKCTACGSVEVELDRVDGVGQVDGEPCDVGYGCEVCS